MTMRMMTVVAGAATMAVLLASSATAEQSKPHGANAGAAQQGWNTNVAADQANAGVLDENQTAMIRTVNAYFNGLTSLKGHFVQTTADKKRAKGKFYMFRPGKFRFEYSLPSKQLIVSDGEYLAIQDLDLNNEDRIALDQTAFRLLLRKDVDLLRDARIIDVQQAEDLIILTVQDKSPDTPGRIKLFMATKPAVELKEWVTSDAQGLDTRVEVSDLAKGDTLDPELFKIKAVGLIKNQ